MRSRRDALRLRLSFGPATRVPTSLVKEMLRDWSRVVPKMNLVLEPRQELWVVVARVRLQLGTKKNLSGDVRHVGSDLPAVEDVVAPLAQPKVVPFFVALGPREASSNVMNVKLSPSIIARPPANGAADLILQPLQKLSRFLCVQVRSFNSETGRRSF